VEAKILAARWSSHVRSPENTAVWIMMPNSAMNRTHKQRRFACRLCAGYRKRSATCGKCEGPGRQSPASWPAPASCTRSVLAGAGRDPAAEDARPFRLNGFQRRKP
jgi:hypothetical protein